MSWKQANVEANDRREGNEEKANVCCSYGSVWSNGCRASAEECVDVDSQPGVVGW